MVNDATASYSDVEMRAALEVNIPNYASAILTTDQVVATMCFSYVKPLANGRPGC